MKGLEQLCQEGTVQMFIDDTRVASDPIVAAVGSLQFDVLLFRLKNEYNVDCSLENLAFKHARWTSASDEEVIDARNKADVTAAKDLNNRSLFLFKNDFSLSYFQDHFPKIPLFKSNATLHKNMMKMSSTD